MMRCSKCGVTFTGELDQCPLCNGALTGEPTPAIFPSNEVQKSGAFALKVMAFVTGVALLVMLFFWLLIDVPGDVVFTICLALVLNYLFVRNVLMHNPDFLRIIARYFFLLLAVAAIWFLFTRYLWITTFIIPGICLLALAFSAVLVSVFQHTFVTGYAKYLLFNVVMGFIPMALLAFGLITWKPLAYISALVASTLALALFIFMRKEILAEIRKLFTA